MNHYKTERLILEYANEKDAEELFPIWSDYEVTQFTMVKNINGIDDCKARINRQIGWGIDNSIGPLIIRENGKAIGYCGGRKNEMNEIEIFYHIVKEKWGSGFGTEIVKAMIWIGFKEKKAVRILAEAAIENIASWKVLEKAGMKRVGTKAGEFENREGIHDLYEYEIQSDMEE